MNLDPGVQAALLGAPYEMSWDGVFMHTDCGSRKEADSLIELARKNWLKL